MTDDQSTMVDPKVVEWVNATLVELYELHGRIPECWPAHPGVVNELSVLHQVFADADSSGVKDRLAGLDALEKILNRIANQYATGECIKHREHKLPRRWAGQPDERAAARKAARRPLDP